MFKKLIAVAVVALSVFAVSACSTSLTQNPGSVKIEGAWVRASTYSDHIGGMTGIFAKFTNNTNKVVTIVGGETDISDFVQTHQVVDGVMSEKKGGIEIKPGQSVTLEPGGLHIMIMNIKKAIMPGDKLTFTFKFKNAASQTQTLTAKVSEGGSENYKK